MRKGKNGARRIAALICSVALAATLLPAQVLAADEATLPDQQVQADTLEADGTGNSTENGTNVEPGTDTEAGTVEDNGSGQTDTETGAGEEAGSGTETDADTEGSTDKETGTGAEAGTDTGSSTDTEGATDAETDTDTEGSTDAETNIDAEAGNDAKGNVENGSGAEQQSADDGTNSGDEGSAFIGNYTESNLVSRPAQLSAQEGAVAKIGDAYYETLDDAVGQADEGAVIELLQDVTTSGLNIHKTLTIQAADGLENKPTITFEDQGIAVGYGDKGKMMTLTFKDVNVNMAGIGTTPATGEWNWVSICVGENASFTLDSVNMTMDGTGTKSGTHAIYFSQKNDFTIINGSNLTIQNYPHNALEWNGGYSEYNVNIKDSTFRSDHNRSGFAGTFQARFENSHIDVVNSTGNGSNGSNFEITNSIVNFTGNKSHGLSAGNLQVSNSTVTACNNGYIGIAVGGSMEISDHSSITVSENANGTYGYAAVRLYNNYNFSLDGTSALTITDNYNTGLYVRQGTFTVEEGAKLKITGNKVTNSLLDGYGGGLYVGYGDNYDPTIILPAGVEIYNNHSLNGGDDIYVSEGVNGPSLTFPAVGSDWQLDGDPDCTDAIDGWYDDSENARWSVHGTGTYHAELFKDFADGMATVTGLKALKAAHAEAATLEPADITIYMGGDQGYDGVVNDQGTIEKTNSLPEPGYYITLPDKVNAALQAAGIVEGNAPVNLSDYITIHTIGAEGEHNWKLKQYGNTYSEAYNKYIYAIEPEDETAPLRLTFTQGENVYQQDEFDPSQVGALNNTYTMDVYSELVNAKRVFLQVTIPQKQADGTSTTNTVYECVMNTEPGTLDVRYVTGDQDSVVTDIVTDVAEVADGSHAYAVAPSGTTYYINDSKIDVTSSAAPSLLFDDVVTDENTPGAQDYSDQLLEHALTQIGTTMQQPLYQAKYLDLVDANNGNVWLTASNPVKIYWPYPAGTNQNTQFYLVHFEGMDRKMGTGEIGAAIDKANVQKVDVTNTEYGVCFEASSFSPFVLMWENPDQKVEEDEQPSQTPAPTAAPTPVPTATPAPTAVPTATPVGVIPQTGDTMPVGLLGGIALVAVVAFVVLLVLRKRKHDD